MEKCAEIALRRMTGKRPSLLAGFLALCLAAAGFVGLIPALHHAVEHGGLGAPHSHHHGGVHWHDHGDGHRHGHPHGPAEDHTDHEHHGLVRQMMDGLIEAAPDWLPPARPAAVITGRDPTPHEFLPQPDWPAHAASRAPPVSQPR